MSDTRILVVEDDRDIGDLVARYLTRAGFTVELLTSGREALTALANRPPDLLVAHDASATWSVIALDRATGTVVIASATSSALPRVTCSVSADQLRVTGSGWLT